MVFPIAAALLMFGGFGCGAEAKELRRDFEAMRAELQMMRRENGELARQVERLSTRPESTTCAPSPKTIPDPSLVIPPNLTVVKIEPPRQNAARSDPRSRRAPFIAPITPPVPTAVPIREPDREVLASLGESRRDLPSQAQVDLDAAHARSGLPAARALVAFTNQYPHHPSADNALVEAARLRADAGDPDGACEIFEQCVKEYPAGDAMPEALEQLGECYARRGRMEQAHQFLKRVVNDYPETSAAKRASERLAEATGGGTASTTSSRQGATP